jgi:hypothetical protein
MLSMFREFSSASFKMQEFRAEYFQLLDLA